MRLIVGLVNPVQKYALTRHNIGFMIVEELARLNKAQLKKKLFGNASEARVNIGLEEAVILKPLTFMNLSGLCVARYVKKLGIGFKDLLVVCDDVNLKFGRIRIRHDGSSGGHNGLESIISQIGSEGFARLRVGIGEKDDKEGLAGYVLSKFTKEELRDLGGIVNSSCQACESWVGYGTEKTMSIFNK